LSDGLQNVDAQAIALQARGAGKHRIGEWITDLAECMHDIIDLIRPRTRSAIALLHSAQQSTVTVELVLRRK
jgi:ornithine carbamoyltransferase